MTSIDAAPQRPEKAREQGRRQVTSRLLAGGDLPIVLEPAEAGVVLADWCAANRETIEELRRGHGAVLFRGFDLPAPADFERTVSAACGELFSGYGDLPRNAVGERIYQSTPYPPDHMILWHNESSHLASWPMWIGFYCAVPATSGGCTPIVDGRTVLRELDPGVVAAFRAHGLSYVRNFTAGVEPTWQAFFGTSDREQVARACRAAGSTLEWRRDGGLRLYQRARAIRTHPITGEEAFFNQIQLHHIACVDEETREGLRALFDEDDLPRNVFYGDGTPIPDEVVAHVLDVYRRLCVRFVWQHGDMIVLENMLTAHARDTYEGPREIAVAMGGIVTAEDFAA